MRENSPKSNHITETLVSLAAMAFYNGSLPLSDAWPGYLGQAQQFTLTPRVILLALLNIPVFAVVFNILWQLVGVLS